MTTEPKLKPKRDKRKLTPSDVKDELLKRIKYGVPIFTAGASVGVHERRLRSWLNRGMHEKRGVYRELYDAVMRADAESEAHYAALLAKHAQEDPRSVQYWLDRRRPMNWAPDLTKQLNAGVESFLEQMQAGLTPEEYERVLVVVAKAHVGAAVPEPGHRALPQDTRPAALPSTRATTRDYAPTAPARVAERREVTPAAPTVEVLDGDVASSLFRPRPSPVRTSYDDEDDEERPRGSESMADLAAAFSGTTSTVEHAASMGRLVEPETFAEARARAQRGFTFGPWDDD